MRRRDLKGILMFLQRQKPEFRGRGEILRRQNFEVTKPICIFLDGDERALGQVPCGKWYTYPMDAISNFFRIILDFLLQFLTLVITFFISILNLVLEFARSLVGSV
jgi:hypothetical protein